MLDWLLGITEANRWISVSYCLGSFIFTAIFIAILFKFKRKRELIIGFLAGLGMLITELILMSSGFRIVETPDFFHPIFVLIAMGFNPMFFVGSITYSTITWALTKKKDFYYKLIFAFFVIGYLVFSLSTKFLPPIAEITTRRLMFNAIYLLEALLAIIFFFINYKILGLKKLTKISFAIGILINFIIEGTMILAGIRWYTGSAWLKFPFHVLFELNAAIMPAIFALHKLGFLSKIKKLK